MFIKLIAAAVAFFAAMLIAPTTVQADCLDFILDESHKSDFQQRTGIDFTGRIEGKFLARYDDGTQECATVLNSLMDPQEIKEAYQSLARPGVQEIWIMQISLEKRQLLLDLYARNTALKKGDTDSIMADLGVLLRKKRIPLKVDPKEETTLCRGTSGFTKVEVTLITTGVTKRGGKKLYMAAAYFVAVPRPGFSPIAKYIVGRTNWHSFRNPGAMQFPRSQVCGILREFSTRTPAQQLLSGL